MKKAIRRNFIISLCLLAAFVLWTVLVSGVDIQAIGPQNSSVGFATFNGAFHNLTGVNMQLYNLTDLLSIIPLGFVAGFALLGLVQFVKRKNLFKVDYSIFVLGGFYIAVMALFLFFEKVVINYRPILIEGVLEASYPSSTTMLVMCVMPTALMQLNSRIRNKPLKLMVALSIVAFTAFMVISRLVSGVHWISDIIGGALLSAGLVMMYFSFCNLKTE